jgi:hypothetical protein
MVWRSITALTVCGVLFAGAVFSQMRADSHASVADHAELLYLPNQQLLKHFTGGMDTVVANLLWLNCVLFTGQQIKGEGDFTWLRQMMQAVTDLDPYFVDAYRYGGMFLAALQTDAEASLDLLKKGIVKNPHAWELPYEAAMVWLLNRSDEPGARMQAAHYLALAAVHEDCPLVVRELAAKLQGEYNLTDIEAQMWAKLRESDDGLLRDLAERKQHEMQIRANLKTLRDLVDMFREGTGRPPENLDEIIAAGLIRHIPPDPLGGRYFLGPDRTPLNTSLLDSQVDKDLAGLRTAIDRYEETQGAPPESLEALVAGGQLLEIPGHPYPSGSWAYDPTSGTVKSSHPTI